jgi:hypothetical protein
VTLRSNDVDAPKQREWYLRAMRVCTNARRSFAATASSRVKGKDRAPQEATVRRDCSLLARPYHPFLLDIVDPRWLNADRVKSRTFELPGWSLAISGGASRRDAAEDFNARFKPLSDSISSFEPGYPLRLFLEPPGDPGRPFLELPLDVDVEISPNTARKSASRVRSSSKAAQSSAV